MYSRLAQSYLKELLKVFPAVSVEGLKGVGKTFTSSDVAHTVFKLDQDADLAAISNDFMLLADSEKPVLVDEWMKFPPVWDYVRRSVDDGALPGSFIVADSSIDRTLKVHSGAGRIVRLQMFPLSLEEREMDKPTVRVSSLLRQKRGFSLKISGKTDLEIKDYLHEIMVSGLPGIRGYDGKRIKVALRSYLDYLLEHDFASTGIKIKQPTALRRWLTGYAAAVGTDASYTEIGDAATAGISDKPAAKTTLSYREALHNLWLIDELEPWSYGENYFSRLKQTPKRYLADPAFAALLLQLDEGMLVDRRVSRLDAKYGNITGRLFESLVFQSLRSYSLVNEAPMSYLRLRNGDREVDFILQNGQSIVAIEAKMTAIVSDEAVSNLVWLKNRMGNDLLDALVVYTGSVAYRRPDGIAVVPAALLGA
jgi:predicted AAA+ superfamily ATPase